MKFQVQLKIRKPVAEVFAAVVEPGHLSGYFVEAASGPMVAGATVKWKFPEFPDWYDVDVLEVVEPQRLVLAWQGGEGYKTRFQLTFRALDAANTMVEVTESGWPSDEAGLQLSYGNCGGWMHMLCGLKAHLEYGINLREGGAM